MTSWMLILAAVVLVGAALAVLIGQVRETIQAKRLAASLSERAPPLADARVDFSALAALPPPVARYFRHVLTDGQRLISLATWQQSGELRTRIDSANWSPFTASQVVSPPNTGFLWNAKVRMPLATHVRVLDSYISGVGSGRVSLLSAVPLASESGVAELNSGALHRYLAEAVWFPTALLPQSGVVWQAIDDHSALATLSHRGTSVSLTFRFNDAAEVTGIHSTGRYGRFDGGYRQTPWEGHFRDDQIKDGMRIPMYGEVGWYQDEALQLVWKGRLTNMHHQFEP